MMSYIRSHLSEEDFNMPGVKQCHCYPMKLTSCQSMTIIFGFIFNSVACLAFPSVCPPYVR